MPIKGGVLDSLPSAWRRKGLSKEQLKAWPAYDIFPDTPWNYGLVLDKKKPETSFEVVQNRWPSDNHVWASTKTPIEMKAKGRRIPGWRTDEMDLVGLLSQSPVKSDEPVEGITLVPMGSARLRLSAFPVIDNGPGGHPWAMPPEPPLKRRPAAKPPASSTKAPARNAKAPV